jgi:hypothetical protein
LVIGIGFCDSLLVTLSSPQQRFRCVTTLTKVGVKLVFFNGDFKSGERVSQYFNPNEKGPGRPKKSDAIIGSRDNSGEHLVKA